MKKCKLMAISMLTMAACFLQVAGCMTEVTTEGDSAQTEIGAPQSDEALSEADDQSAVTSAAPANATRVWKFVGSENCFDLCNFPRCNCISPICPGTPVEGQPCNYTGRINNECFSRPRGLSTILYSCG